LNSKRILVVGAHAADWVWRSSGTIAKYIASGYEVFIVCLTFGVRGESSELWKIPGQTVEKAKKVRYEEAVAAAKFLGVTTIEMWDYPDYMLEINEEILLKLAEKIREVRPAFIITHDYRDDTNLDHVAASNIVFQASIIAKENGIDINGLPPTKSIQIYGFEPSQTETSGFVPQVYIDITDQWEIKLKAMAYIAAQPKTPAVHQRINTHRGWLAARIPGGSGIKYAEAYTVRYPIAVDTLPERPEHK